MKALIIIDMLNDFVDGELANPRAQAIVPEIKRLLRWARKEGWIVVFSNDAHYPDDPELKIWGEHAMAGTPGAQVIPELEPLPDEIISLKRNYGAFDGTELNIGGVDEVVLVGQHTHICVRHTAYGALIRGYEITVPRDAVCAFTGINEEEALVYLETVYGANITTIDDLIYGPLT